MLVQQFNVTLEIMMVDAAFCIMKEVIRIRLNLALKIIFVDFLRLEIILSLLATIFSVNILLQEIVKELKETGVGLTAIVTVECVTILKFAVFILTELLALIVLIAIKEWYAHPPALHQTISAKNGLILVELAQLKITTYADGDLSVFLSNQDPPQEPAKPIIPWALAKQLI